jgi:hypothetical protein
LFPCTLATSSLQADADVKDAQAKIAAASAAFTAARDKANTDLATAQRNFAAADQAFNDARNRAYNDLNNAVNAVNRAQAE